jgi:hypothetical protein
MMTVAIGGYLLMAIAGHTPTIANAVREGEIVKAFDSAEDCETEKIKLLNVIGTRTLACIPALATVNR